jgi:hypothetical protein
LASLGTALLMLRALFLLAGAAHKPEMPRDVALPWLAMTGPVVLGLSIADLALLAFKAASMADRLPLVAAAGLARLAVVLLRLVRLRLEPAAPGELRGMLRDVPPPKRVLALLPPSSRRVLVARRRVARRPAAACSGRVSV